MIGYYVHHHGAGHGHRFSALAAEMPGELVGLGSGPRPSTAARDAAWVPLASDADGPPALDPTAGGALHWSPLRHPGMQERTAQLAAWVAEARPAAIVVDVSVEVALTARLLSVPTVLVAQHGARDDPPHRLAYASASAVVALWHAGQHPDPPAAAGSVRHVGPISRFDGRIGAPGTAADRLASAAAPPSVASAAAPAANHARTVLLLLGRGGHAVRAEDLTRARAATAPDWQWEVLGDPALGGHEAPADAVWAALHRADVVVAPASNNCVAEVAAARRPFVALPQDRPFGEQRAHAAQLRASGLAEVVDGWPAAEQWPDVLQAAVARGGEVWSSHATGQGAARFAAAVREVAAR